MNNHKVIARWFLLVGVMTGLFFSSGEGIQLLPFSAGSATGEKNVSELERGKSKSYSYTVRNSAVQSVAVKSKDQKNPNLFEYAGISRVRDEFPPLISFNPAHPHNYRHPLLSNRSLVAATPSDRAPPAA